MSGSTQLFGVQTFVEVYPFEGSPMLLTAPKILAVEASKNIRDSVGRFTLALQPGGPNGPDSQPSWTDIITTHSLVVIGMRRGAYSQVVMIGVVTARADEMIWESGKVVVRSTAVTGEDFANYFNSFNYYTLSLIGMTAGAVEGPSNFTGGQAIAFPALLAQAQSTVSPDQLGMTFYNSAMVGKDSGVLGNCYVPYKNNSQIKLYDAIGTSVLPFPNIQLKTSGTFLTSEGSWMAKFENIFPFPFYEFFVTTAPQYAYGKVTNSTNNTLLDQGPGYAFNMQALPDAPAASPVMVARPLPFPRLTVSTTTEEHGFKITGIDTSDWKALTVFSPDSGSAIMSSPGFSVDEVRNFYALNPTGMQDLNALSSTSQFNFLYGTMVAVDFASINRYGYRPEIVSFDWLYSNTDTDATASGNVQLVGDLLARVCSYHEPVPLMTRAEATINLRPDILPGNIFRYRPYKTTETWDFYIEGVTHRYDFRGMQAVTTLNLSRGLPTSIYNDDSNSALLINILSGDAMLYGGDYTSGLPPNSAPPLTSFGPGDNVQNYLGRLAPAFSTAQFDLGP